MYHYSAEELNEILPIAISEDCRRRQYPKWNGRPLNTE